MKRYIIFLFLVLTGGLLWAQDMVRDSVPAAALPDSAAVDSTDADEENVIGVKPTKREKQELREANILGAPVYYDNNGNVRGSSNPSAVYHRPKHHYLNNLDDRYCSFFAEGEWILGAGEWGLGLNLTYIPERWGAYASMLGGVHRNYLSAGPALRLSGYENTLDWHLYGGLITNFHSLGAEVGLRMATAKHNSEFCWTSVSAGAAIVGGNAFLTFGASIDIVALFIGATTLLFW